MGIEGLIVVGAVIIGVILSGRRKSGSFAKRFKLLRMFTQTSVVRPVPNPTSTSGSSQNKYTSRPATAVPAAVVVIPTRQCMMTFDNSAYDGSYNTFVMVWLRLIRTTVSQLAQTNVDKFP
jgi:hypothetical protein